MFSLPVMIALGPCLMMGMASVALCIVHRGFSQTPHALLWAAGSALGGLQWGCLAARGLLGWAPLHTGLAVDVLGLLSVALLAGGFGVRATGRVPRLMLAMTWGALALLGLLFLVPPMPIRSALTPLFSIAVLGWMATRVPRDRERVSATEVLVVATLLAVVLIHGGGVAAAVAEQIGWLGSHRPYQLLYLVTVEPASAAVALAAMLLIAFDFCVALRRLAHADPLTGVLNRDGFEHAAHTAWRRARARPLVIALADIDRFKQVNDRLGHQAGDRALAAVAAHLAAGVGRDGMVARVGGEEFTLLLPGLDAAAAWHRIEALRRGLGELRLDGHPELHLSASFGIAQRMSGDRLDDILERADVALYRSKRDGRDRTTVAPLPTGAAT